MFQNREIRLRGTLMYPSEGFAPAIDLLALDVGPMSGARVPMTRAADGYATAARGRSLKVLLVP